MSDELGDDGQFEATPTAATCGGRPCCTSPAPLADGAALVAWVDERRTLGVGEFRARSLDLVRYEYDGARTAPVTLASVPLES